MKKLLYFAYGSNLSTERLASRIGEVIERQGYVLENYRLEFNCQGFANIEPSIGDQVEGFLYEVTSDQISLLNQFEGFYNAEFLDFDAETLIVVYVGKEHIVARSKWMNWIIPEKYYLNIIIEGAKTKNLSRHLIAILTQFYNSIPDPKPLLRKQVKKFRNKSR